MNVLHVGIALIYDKEQFSASVADFDYFFMIFSVLYENVDTDNDSMFYALEYRYIRQVTVFCQRFG